MPHIVAVHINPTHTFSKLPQPSIYLLAGLGVEGDAHCGAQVRHRYLRRRNPAAPNRMQVHLLPAELLATLAREAHESRGACGTNDPLLAPAILPGQFGENITTGALALEQLPLGTRLHLGTHAIVELTCLRTPCRQMNDLRPNLMKASFLPGTRTPRAGVMAIVLASGTVHPGDPIRVDLPSTPHQNLQPA